MAAFPSKVYSIYYALVRRFMLLIIVAFAAFLIAAYFIVLAPATEQLAAGQLERAQKEVSARWSTQVERVERLILSAREWGLRGYIDLDDVEGFNSTFIPLLEHHPFMTATIFADNRGKGILLLKQANGEWHNRVSDPETSRNRHRWLKWSATGEFLGEESRYDDYNYLQRPCNLSVARGTLTEEERYKINEHIVRTIIMLSQLPLPPHLKSVPELAGGHH